jgi:hypothetical protein
MKLASASVLAPSGASSSDAAALWLPTGPG